ncbi:MAG: YggS family pyridoxal phosphate-dependent enzyme [Deltaproteobacteria bacterium]|nr:YggS family pyridoxal phosphate-dependent enzyme [Deltaproteobacteria bacterium]
MIKDNVKRIQAQLPEGVQLVGAAKTRSMEEIVEAIEAGLTIIGHNYVQEAERLFDAVSQPVKWHMIGHLQSNKAKKAAAIFDMIETVDSVKLAKAIDKACKGLNKTMPILLEINSGQEDQKAGIMPENAARLLQEISTLSHVKVRGLMTMGPFTGDPEETRPYFRKTKILFDELIALNLAKVDMSLLSMGMSNSYEVAIEEGANLVRIGTKLFGERVYDAS